MDTLVAIILWCEVIGSRSSLSASLCAPSLFYTAVFEVDPTHEFSVGEGIEKVGETASKLQFEMCQSEFCFDLSVRNVTRENRGSGRFEIFLAATPEYGRIIVLDPEKTRGYIEIR